MTWGNGGDTRRAGNGDTCDVLAQLIILLPQRPQQLKDAILLHQSQLVVSIIVDEVTHGTCGMALHLLVGMVEELHQPWHCLKAAGLRHRNVNYMSTCRLVCVCRSRRGCVHLWAAMQMCVGMSRCV